MKIRHKQSGVVLEGYFCTMSEGNARGSRTYYMQTGIGPHSQYDATEWEEVRPEWVDVTSECETNKYDNIIVRKGLGCVSTLCDKDGYRLRKVHISEMEADMRKHAFIIEQRRS